MTRLLLALAALVAVVAVSSAEDPSMTERQLVAQLLEKLEKRHREGPNGHTHGQIDIARHRKPMATKEPMATKAPMPTKASKGKEERSEDRLTAVELRELKDVLMALHKRAEEVYRWPNPLYKPRQCFKSESDYGEYVAKTVKVGSKVMVFNNKYAQKLPGINAGFIGTVQEIDLAKFAMQSSQIKVHFDKDTDGAQSDHWSWAWYYNIVG